MKDPTCRECRGACCEFFWLTVPDGQLEIADNPRWYQLRLGCEVKDGRLLVTRSCPALKVSGKCMIYAHRPEACKAMPVGSPECLEAIELRRPAYHAKLQEGR